MTRKKFIGLLSVIATIFAVLGGFWGFEDRYAKSADVKELEVQVVKTLKEFSQQQMQIQQTYEYKNDYKFYQFQYDKLGNDLINLRREMRTNPDDQLLKEDYNEVKHQRELLKQKMDSLLEKIK